MKKLILILITIFLFSCEKEVIVQNPTGYYTCEPISQLPFQQNDSEYSNFSFCSDVLVNSSNGLVISINFESDSILCQGSWNGNNFSYKRPITYGDGYFITNNDWLWLYIRGFGNETNLVSCGDYGYIKPYELDPNDPTRIFHIYNGLTYRDYKYYYTKDSNGDLLIDVWNNTSIDENTIRVKKI